MVTMSKSNAAKWGVFLRRRREAARLRFYISFRAKGSYLGHRPNGNPHFARYAWPILFHTADEAWAYLRAVPIFHNRDKTEHRGRLYSVSVEQVWLPSERNSK